MGAPGGARRPQRGDRVDAVRAGPRCVRVASPHDGRSRRRSPTVASTSCRRRSSRSPSRRSRISSARSSPSRAAGRTRRSTAPFASSRAPASAARSSSSARSCCRCFGPALPPEQIGIVCPSLERWQAPLETALRHARRSVRARGLRAVRQDAVRPGAAQPAPLRVARGRPRAISTRSCARRTRASRGRTSTSSRAACADVPSQTPERVEEETIRLRDGQPLPSSRRLRGAPTPLDAVAGSRRSCCAPPTGSRRRPSASSRDRTSARTRP